MIVTLRKGRLRLRMGFHYFTIALIALKPLIDAFSERSRDVVLSPGAIWTALALVAGAFWLVSRRSLRPAQLVILGSCAGLIAGATVAFWNSGDAPGITLEVSRVIAGLLPGLILLGTLRKRPPAEYKPFLVSFAAGVLLHSAVAIMQSVGAMPTTYFQHGSGRPSGLYYHPVSFGILMTSSMLVVATAHLRGWLRFTWAFGLAAVLSGLTLLSTHRTSIAVSAVVLLGWGVLHLLSFGRHVRVSLKVVAIVILAVVALGAIAALSFEAVSRVVISGVENVVGVLSESDFDPGSDTFLRGRGERWALAISAIESGSLSEKLFGYGRQIVDPHSDFLRVPLVHGAVGSVLLGFALIALAAGFAGRSDATGRRLIWLLVACALVYSITTKPTSFPYFMWAMSAIAWIVASSSRAKRVDQT